MEQSELMVRRIKEGTVIDHIDEGKGLQVLDALRIDGQDGSLITLAMNVPSGKSKKKDIIKVENKFLKDDDTNKIAIIASKATINIIKNYKLIEKSSPYSQQFSAQIIVFFKGFSPMEPKIIIRKDCRSYW